MVVKKQKKKKKKKKNRWCFFLKKNLFYSLDKSINALCEQQQQQRHKVSAKSGSIRRMKA